MVLCLCGSSNVRETQVNSPRIEITFYECKSCLATARIEKKPFKLPEI